MSNRLKLIKAATLVRRPITIEAEDGPFTVEARGLDITTLGAIQGSATTDTEEDDGETTRSIDLAKMTPQLLIAGTFDPETNTPIFTAADLELVGTLSAGVLQPVLEAVMELSGMGEKTIKRAEKNSVAIPTNTSSTVSSANSAG